MGARRETMRQPVRWLRRPKTMEAKENLKLKDKITSLEFEKNDDLSYTEKLREIIASLSQENDEKDEIIRAMCNEAKEKENASCLAQKILVELDKELENAQDSIKGLTIGVKKVDDMISFTRSMVTRVKSQLPPQVSQRLSRGQHQRFNQPLPLERLHLSSSQFQIFIRPEKLNLKCHQIQSLNN
ncbi:hypothetical protein ACOSQ4_003345 [Xanthoceras sorbifolium]